MASFNTQNIYYVFAYDLLPDRKDGLFEVARSTTSHDLFYCGGKKWKVEETRTFLNVTKINIERFATIHAISSLLQQLNPQFSYPEPQQEVCFKMIQDLDVMQLPTSDFLSTIRLTRPHPLLQPLNESYRDEIQNLIMTSNTRRNSLQTSSENQHEIFPGLLLGNLKAYEELCEKAKSTQPAKDASLMYFIFSVTDAPLDKKPLDNVIHRTFSIQDDNSAWSGLEPYLIEIFTLLDLARLNKKIALIHCSAGRSRSASVLIAYLMWSCQLPYDKVLNFVKAKRFWIHPSEALTQGLKKLEKTLLSNPSENKTQEVCSPYSHNYELK